MAPATGLPWLDLSIDKRSVMTMSQIFLGSSGQVGVVVVVVTVVVVVVCVVVEGYVGVMLQSGPSHTHGVVVTVVVVVGGRVV